MCNEQVIKLQRMNRKNKDEDGSQILVDKQVVIVTFLGNKLPQKIKKNLSYFTVEPYIQPGFNVLNALDTDILPNSVNIKLNDVIYALK